MCPSNVRADMASLQRLNAFICERLTAAAVDIFGAVEKTLVEYQGEISRSKQEIDHLRTLVLWPEVRLHRSAAHQVRPQCCHEEECAPDVSPHHPSTLHVKEEHDQRQQSDAGSSPRVVKGEGCEGPPSHLYRILTVEHTADIKAEPDGEEFIASASTGEAEIPCGVNPESAGLQRETLIDRLEITHHEQQCNEQARSPSQDPKAPEPPHIKVERFTSYSPQEETDHDYRLPLQSESSHDQILTNTTVKTAVGKRRDAGGEGCQLSRLTRVSQPFYSVNQSEYGENTDGVVNGDWFKALTPTGRRPKKRQNSDLCHEEGRESFATDEDVNDVTRERRHTCPICAKRFKESNHLKDHVRIHTGEKPYRCKQCGMNFRQSGALTLHMRIHTGERPYQCADCGRRFIRKGDMETHRVTHTGERPHLCVVCGKSFKRKSNLNSHLKIHAEDRMDYTQPV